MSRYTGTSALIEALRDWRRNVSTLVFVVVVLAGATFIGSREAYYAASLIIFATWMIWFIVTGIEWIKRADF
ncbi:hypothetical protein [Halocatena marina]|uniref:Uncharacterized protein n=1 Tax=Halocatena marina TaxID=2934937 RepID=A0ABD5YWR9_9EURY|nr:hypothetical protein [Halocatena marina]